MATKTRKQLEDDVETLYKSVIGGQLFPGGDPIEDEANEIIRRMNAGRVSDNAKEKILAMRMAPALKTVIIRMVYGTDDPKMVPIAYIKHALMYPSPIRNAGGFFRKDQREAINGPTKAIRIMCLECQGQDTAGVRQCAATSCVLWPFRMNFNPFFGRLRGSEDEATETEAEIDALEAERLLAPGETTNAH